MTARQTLTRGQVLKIFNIFEPIGGYDEKSQNIVYSVISEIMSGQVHTLKVALISTAAAKKMRLDKKKAFMGGALHHVAETYLPFALQPLPLFKNQTPGYLDQTTMKHARQILKVSQLETMSIFPYLRLGIQGSLNQTSYHGMMLKRLYEGNNLDFMNYEMMMISRIISIADAAELFSRTRTHPGWHKPGIRIYLEKRFPGYASTIDKVIRTAQKISL